MSLAEERIREVLKINARIAELERQQTVLVKALSKIEKWFGEFPPTGKTWATGEEMSYSAAYGSNGERDFMRSVAREALAAVKPAAASQAVTDVLAERVRQVEAEGWTPEHDDANSNGEMAVAGGLYALRCGWPHERELGVPSYWPWDKSWWKPSTTRRNLVKAGALIIAEIERLDRAAVKPAGQKGSE